MSNYRVFFCKTLLTQGGRMPNISFDNSILHRTARREPSSWLKDS